MFTECLLIKKHWNYGFKLNTIQNLTFLNITFLKLIYFITSLKRDHLLLSKEFRKVKKNREK